MAVAMAGVMITTPFMLAGCADGKDGQDGTVWKSGTSYTTFTDAKVGDYFIDTDDYVLYQKGDNGWTVVMENFGKPGNNGQDGTSVYVGYDGYIWSGAERTTFKLENSVVDESVAEDTLGLYGNKYFTQNVVSTAKPIALMGNYFPTIKKTGYSGTTIKEISVYADKAGTLEIGTASVENIVNSRTNGTTLTTTTTAYPVVAGLNTIALNLSVADTDTVVLGGGTSNVNVYAYENVNGADEYGFYTVCDEQARTELFELTGDVKDKLVVKVKASVSKEQLVMASDYRELYTGKVSALTTVKSQYATFIYLDGNSSSNNISERFENKTITRITLPIQAINDTNNAYFTVYKLNKTGNQTFSIAETIKVYLSEEFVENFDSTNGEWADIDLTQNGNSPIVLGENQTLAFGAVSGDTVNWAYNSNSNTNLTKNSEFAFYNCNGNTSATSGANTNENLMINVYHLMETTIQENINKLSEDERVAILKAQEQAELEALKTALSSRFTNGSSDTNIEFSILGDSISTYQGYSNNSTDTNSTIESNAVYYNGSNYITDVNDTWWKQAANLLDMNILVNNSYSGDRVTTNGQTRCEQLHDDTGENAGTNPEIIAVYLGINDFDNNVSLDNFTTSYRTMIQNLTTKYSTTDVFLFTHVPNGSNSRTIEELEEFNAAIKSIASEFGCYVVDLYSNSGITKDNYSTYMGDNSLHPNATGMDQITNCFIEALKDVYLTQE